MIPPTRIFRIVAFAAFICSLVLGVCGVFAQESDTLSVQLPGGQHVITFRRLPKIANATPLASVNADTASSEKGEDSQPYELPSVYLAEKELSLLELRTLVSEKTWDAYAARVLACTGTDEDPKFGGYRKAVREGSEKYPAILVDLGALLEACIKLDTLATEQPEALSLRSDLSTVGFRMPSRIEWQYAARGTQDVAEAKAREVFPKWPQFDKGLMGRWQDLCEKTKTRFDPGRGPTPAEICEAADSMLANNKDKEGYDFLGEVLKKALSFEVNIFRTADQNILPVDSGAVDSGGFRRLLGNASEWTIDRKSLEEVESLWNSLKQADAAALSKDTRALGFIMGGQFLNTVPQRQSWMNFSIAGGQSKGGAPFSVQDATPDGEVLKELKAGVRLCVRRSVSPQWFVPYRRAVRKGQDLAKMNQDFSKSFLDLCIATEFDKLAKVLKAYELRPEVAEASDDEAHVTSFTDSMIAAARAFDKSTGKPAAGESAADEAIRRLRAAGLGGNAGGKDTPNKDSDATKPKQQPKRDRGSAPKPNYFDVLGSMNRS
ncbi:MAG: hypothetical protein DWH80_08110 [Planctomycetota bacterium]|nr:MAG: hypothetical protein DWH80_08110 [Planctomycetota bacterium]